MESYIELNIYDSSDEIVASYRSRGVRWGVVEDALCIDEQLESMTMKDQISSMKSVVLGVFPDITEEHLRAAYIEDIAACFNSVKSRGNKINTKN